MGAVEGFSNPGFVFGTGVVVPLFETETRQWGEFASIFSPNLELRRLAVPLLNARIKHDFSLTFVLVPRDVQRTLLDAQFQSARQAIPEQP